MDAAVLPARLQTTPIPTETPGTGPEALVDIWPLLVRAAWFFAGFLSVAVVGLLAIEPALSRIVRRRNRNNPTLQEAISRYLRLGVLVVAFVVGTGVAGYGRFLSDSAIVVAALTLAIGVAGQLVIGSLISGFVLVLDPEFNVGDYIEWEGGSGTVRSITLRVTRVQTPDGELVTIPNTVLTGQPVTRPYGRARYRVVEHIGVAYEDDVRDAISLLEDVAVTLDPIANEPNPSAYVDEFGGDAIVVRVHYWIDDPDPEKVFAIRSRYAQAVEHRCEEVGVTISPAAKLELRGRIGVDDSERDTTDE
jgi:small-conductance mechanosensitive channel